MNQNLEQGRSSPFSLADLPRNLGPWQGQDTTLDPQIVRGSGSTDQVIRRYVDQRTGVAVDVVILYGPTSEMFIHIPELCYPSAGFESFAKPLERSIPLAGGTNAPFRSLAFTRGEAGLTELQEVYYSLRYDGGWTTRSTTPRASQRSPGMYKIQASRRIASQERRDLDNPIEPLLTALVGEIEARLNRPTASNKQLR